MTPTHDAEAARMLLARDWSATALGPVSAWPQLLRTMANVCLECSFPAAIAWGADHLLIYNDAYRRYCSAQHPAALGSAFADCWAAVWPAIQPAFAAAASGRPARVADCPISLPGRGPAREAYLTFSFSPVRDETGAVAGVMHLIEDGTARVVGERRAACLGDLALVTGQASTTAMAYVLVARKLGAYSVDLPFVLMYMLAGAGREAELTCRLGLPADSAAAPAVISLADEASDAWPLAAVVRTGAAMVVEGVTARFAGTAGLPAQAMLLPLTAADAGQVTGVLVIGVNPGLALDRSYRDFCLRLAATLSGLLSAARAGEEERRQSEELRAVLMAELDHRVRNILASVQSMVTQSARGKSSRDDYAAVLTGRIAAMARAHGLLTRQHWKGADVADVLHDELQRFGAAVSLAGDAGCFIAPRDAINLALAVHELASNAASFGALSVAEGLVDVRWAAGERRGEPPTVRLVWQESDGPPVRPTRHRGFGSQLIERTLRHVDLRFDEKGVRCTIEIALKQREPADRARQDDARDAETPLRGAPPDKPLRGERVLVVEEGPASALELRMILEEAGAEVTGTAATLPEAVKLTQCGVSAAVLDVNPQGEMGFAIVRRLLERGVRVLMLTGHEVTALPTWLREVPLLRKPVDAAALVQRLAALSVPGR